jgi:hypothetical protein
MDYRYFFLLGVLISKRLFRAVLSLILKKE